MAKVSRVRRLKYRSRNGKTERYQIPSCSHKIFKDINNKSSKLSEKKDWEDANCSVCMESPHNAVLLLCSSYNKGCRPYMCATGYRFSNCLDQYKNAYKKGTPGSTTPGLNPEWPEEKMEASELLCPLCRGQVKGWTLVEPARKYLNKKKRTCMQENCTFVGNYKQLKKHVKNEHPWARPREVDPSLEAKWKSLEREREISDVMSTFSPGTIVLGDYVIDPNFNPFISRDYDMDMDDLLGDELESFGANGIRSGGFQLRRNYDSYDDDDDEDDDDDVVGISRHSAIPLGRHHRRMLFLGRSRRRRRRD
ncbi:hypothetical protein SOVF_121140 [Spinacia oleracea]|uniref:C2H2-type domain-containing protein n=1 Tax=Spinacia oleracea TaxID=3562 RepID=A0A9R0ICX6_SPIOL|nr:uncharacterized protein LOC110786587 [Spinacia oleracea]XP_021846925.2 uncharacterized protein LOC110786587 [Spinacia oleracea]KNA12874.1 hypothetical protein SOVF_121140 [Spinacia oleracea]